MSNIGDETIDCFWMNMLLVVGVRFVDNRLRLEKVGVGEMLGFIVYGI